MGGNAGAEGDASDGSAGADGDASGPCSPPAPKSDGSCFSNDPCNPVTHSGCDGPGAACDTDQNTGKFKCFTGGNTANTCQPCGGDWGYCVAGNLCLDAKCVPYCCGDKDCSPGSTCIDVGGDVGWPGKLWVCSPPA